MASETMPNFADNSPPRMGQLSNLEKFDSAYFGIDPKQADVMDPMGRVLLEKTYEAIVDAGVNPRQLRGTRTGVFVGVSFISESKSVYDEQDREFDIDGSSRGMLANRISYCFDLRGPSLTLDTACSSGISALVQAYRAINDGLCDAAIVGAAHTNLDPDVTMRFFKQGFVAKDGRCKTWDATGDGYVRGEAICALYLQRAKSARRVYASLVHGKINCDGWKERGIHFPSRHLQATLLREVYAECGVPPRLVAYVEAHGTGTKAGDVEEVEAVDAVLGRDRPQGQPLLIGSVKSNLGHTEPASGLTATFKVILAMESGVIAPNLHFNNCRQELAGIVEGRLKVVTEPTPWRGSYAGISNFGFGGANAHVILRVNPKEKIDNGAPSDDLPRLIVVSGRTESAVARVLDDLESKPVDVELLALLYNVHSEEMSGHPYRGYAILPARGVARSPLREIGSTRGVERPVMYIFPGLGSQWAGMGESLLRIPVFSQAMRKCDSVLKPHGIDLLRVITDRSESTFDNALNSIVGITAVQIGLVDVLHSLKIAPDRIVGHSIGELACAYADGCLTAEQAIMAAYHLGLACAQGNFTSGSVDELLKAKDTCSKLLARLKEVIPCPATRSEKWLDTSSEKNELARYASAEYYTSSFRSPLVSFERSLNLVPNDAIVIEVAPHGRFQSVLKQSLPTTVTNVPLMMHRDDKDNLQALLSALGKLFNAGLHPQLAELYPAVVFPVSRGTPIISPMIEWDHRADWYVDYFENQQIPRTGVRVVKINSKHRDYETIAGHVVNGRVVMPAASYLTLIWETFGLIKSKPHTELPVVLENVKFLRAVPVPSDGGVELTLVIQKGTGSFEILDGDEVVVSGSIRSPSEAASVKPAIELNDEEEYMTARDVYTELKLRGYQFGAHFRNITRAAEFGSRAHVAWKGDWIKLLDGLLQVTLLSKDTRETFLPTALGRVVIDPELHRHCAMDQEEFEATYDKLHGVASGGGVQISGVQARSVARRKIAHEAVLEEHRFVPFADDAADTSLGEIAKLTIDLVFENDTCAKVKTVELPATSYELLSPWLVESAKNVPLIQVDVVVLRRGDTLAVDALPEGISVVDEGKTGAAATAQLVVGRRLLADERGDDLNLLLRELKPEGFVLTLEDGKFDVEAVAWEKGYHVVMRRRSGRETFALLRKKRDEARKYIVVNVNNDNFDWLGKTRESMLEALDGRKTDETRIIFVGQDGFDNGLAGFVNGLRKERGGELVRGILVQDPTAPEFSPDCSPYSRQLEKDLAVSVLRENGVWGSYRHFSLPPFQARPVQHCLLSQSVPGNLSSLEWTEGPLRADKDDENLVMVAYAALNFKDIMLATGKLSLTFDDLKTPRQRREHKFGNEYSGTTARGGKRVLGMSRIMANACVADPCLMWAVPDEWSLEDAATVPSVYATCCYALYLKGNMKRGDKILIHSGTGGVGQAAINLALAEGCEVFTTVGSPEKRRFIRDNFPRIAADHVGNSRDTSFERMIMEQTEGRGVDIVLNSLAEEKLLASLECLAWGGRFLEIGKADLTADNQLGMRCFMREISFQGVMLDRMFTATEEEKMEVKRCVDKYLRSGAIKPLARTVFTMDKVEDAFRYMATGKHIGKIVIKMQEENDASISKPIALPRYYCRDDRSYLVLGGLGGFGLELCDWLVMRGAKNLVLTSRSGITTGYQRMRVSAWKSYGVNVLIVADKEASLYDDCRSIVEASTRLAPVDGIFNLAAVLVEASWENQTPETYAETFKSKAWTTRHLDAITREACPELRHFVIFSSIASGRGIPGQTNYAMSNSVIERICERRAAEGLPGLAVQWGAIDDVGIVAGMIKDDKPLVIGGTVPQSIISCMKRLEEFLLQSRPIVSSILIAEKKAAKTSTNVLDSVLNIMCLKDLKGINPNSTLADLGVDSMSSVEIKQMFERELDVFLSEQQVRNLSFIDLKELTGASQ